MTFPILGGNSAVAGYSIDNSLRFNSSDTPNLARTPSASNRDLFTISLWAKRSNLNTGARQVLFGVGNPATTSQVGFEMRFDNSVGDGKLRIGDYVAGVTDYVYLVTDAIFRDVSAWYHIVYVYDSAQATNTNRTKLYVNGNQITSFSSPTYPNQNQDSAVNSATQHTIGNQDGNGYEYNGYLSEINFIDGQALSPTDFGEFDTDSGIWKPISYSGSYGTNGFYLDFENSGSLGADQSGNGNNFTPTNLASTDQTTDTPTNNFSTLNALRFSSSPTYSEGNLKAVTTSEAGYVSSSIAVKTGKWYWETRFSSIVTSVMVGVQNVDIPQNTTFYQSGRFSYGSTGSLYYDSASESLATYTTGDIIGIALDMDGDSISWYKNNTLVTTKTLSSYTIDTSKEVEHFIMSGSSGGSAGLTVSVNYGQNGSFNGTETAQGNSDGNGYGDFYYAPPSGYLALCTQNLATVLSPTIDDGSQYFNSILYTGTSVNPTSRTGVGFQPDWIWAKERSSTSSHRWIDSSRGNDKVLESNATDAEVTRGDIQSFDSDGFTTDDGGAINESGQTYIAWNWLAGGGSVSNSDGSISSQVNVNQTAGFSIVTYTGTGSNATVGHGLGKAPEIIIVKNRDYSPSDWQTGSDYLTSWAYRLKLNGTNAEAIVTSSFNSTAPTSTVINIGNNDDVNRSGDSHIIYAFHSVEGYSKFGSYTGNGSTDGTFVYTGFRPSFILTKASSRIEDWAIIDNKRDTYNVNFKFLKPNTSEAENTGVNRCDFTSNGFKWRDLNTKFNQSGETYIYMAFAESPFCTSSGVPVVAR